MLSVIAFAFLLATPVGYAPDTRYDAAVPTLQQVVGHAPGEEITSPEQIVQYLTALQQAAPDRTRLVTYARSWERRPLVALVIGSPARIAALDSIKADLRRLAEPGALSAADEARLVRDLPVVTWLMHSVHGNEISSSDAALSEAYHLLAARGDASVDTILRESIVIVDPLQNPDGRARYIFQNALGRAATPDPEPASIEHDEPWPGGRSNHYLFDMNRDWFAQSQPETQGRTRLYLEWFPHVVVDLHEMNGDSTYYFAPPADPINPHITPKQRDWLNEFGRVNAQRFDERGFAYFVRETYDSFYPGYGESWPIFHGAVGMTFEQASPRGLAYRREDGSVLTYAEAVLHHLTAALATAETAARNRERILRDFVDYRRTAVAEGTKGIRAYLLPPGIDPARVERLARLLVAQGIVVQRTEEDTRVGALPVPAGTFVVPMAQPASRMVRNLLDPSTPMDPVFLKEQDRRRRKRIPDQFYDVTGWSLPYVFDVEVLTADRPLAVRSTTLSLDAPLASKPLPVAKVAYLLPWGVGTAAAVGEALQQGIKIQSAGQWMKVKGRRFEAGTAIVRVAGNRADLSSSLGPILAKHGVEAVPLDSGFVDEGASLGSGEVRNLQPSRILLAWDRPTSTLSAGWARYVIERRYGHAVTAVRVDSLDRVDLRRYDVLVLPSGNYADAFDEDALVRLMSWVRAGGTIVTLGEASRWAAREKVGLLGTRSELRGGKPEKEPSKKKESDDADDEEDEKPFDLEKAIQPERERPESTPGALLRVVLDRDHWLAAGTDGAIQAVVEGQRVFTPMKLDDGTNVGLYEKRDRLVASGLAWEEAQDQLAQKAFLMEQPLGDGHVIAFAEEPNYRAFTEATQLLFMNALLLAPAY